ncbi:hypothetical protein AG1IA_01831 [Rhizoctonia solani AG-1 IA]|uniref:Uncharacterized protein n=1 Tax=Thanatephorus cucumeris (strain AG1-IA) TaxID=983506 RepID=L8X669_THACA|nr:hypothetical protein AG1IA_01831 [Rhizoctonia solani AG-1 IA]
MAPRTTTRSNSANRSPRDDGSSRGTITTHITSATVLAGKDNHFGDWASAVKLNLHVHDQLPSDSFFDPIRDLLEQSKRFPRWLTNKSPELCYIASGYRTLRDRLCTYLLSSITGQNFRQYTLHDSDPELCAAMGTIFQLCYHTTKLHTNENSTEMDGRFFIDGLIAHVCESDGTAYMKYKLPKTRLENVNVPAMIADGVTYIDIPNFEPYDTSPPLREAASALGSKAFSKTLQLVNCVVEYKRDTDGAHQAMMGIVSGLYQQRAFRNVRQFVFGISQNNASTLNVVVATWQGDNVSGAACAEPGLPISQIKVYNVGSYSLAHPATAVQFYLVLREIKRRAKSDHDCLIACSNALAVDIIDFPPQKWWATKALPNTREQPPETQDELHPTTGQGRQSGGVINIGHPLAQKRKRLAPAKGWGVTLAKHNQPK